VILVSLPLPLYLLPSLISKLPADFLYQIGPLKTTINNSDNMNQIEAQLEFVLRENESLKSQNGYLECINKRHFEMLERTKSFFNLRYDLPREPITLNSHVLSPELWLLGSSMHIPKLNNVIKLNPQTWSSRFSHTSKIAAALGGFGLVSKIIQLPGHGANIIFKSPEARDIGRSKVKRRLRDKCPPVHYSLQSFPKLKKQVKSLSYIFSTLKQEGMITQYCLNNFGSMRSGEMVQPLYSFIINHTDAKPTRFNDSWSIEFYNSGNMVPENDTNFSSNEFKELCSIVRRHVLEVLEDAKRVCQGPSPGSSYCDNTVNSGQDISFMTDPLYPNLDRDEYGPPAVTLEDCIKPALKRFQTRNKNKIKQKIIAPKSEQAQCQSLAEAPMLSDDREVDVLADLEDPVCKEQPPAQCSDEAGINAVPAPPPDLAMEMMEGQNDFFSGPVQENTKILEQTSTQATPRNSVSPSPSTSSSSTLMNISNTIMSFIRPAQVPHEEMGSPPPISETLAELKAPEIIFS